MREQVGRLWKVGCWNSLAAERRKAVVVLRNCIQIKHCKFYIYSKICVAKGR